MADKEIKVETRLGQQKIALDRVLRFPRGLIGYEDKRDFVLLQIREDVPFLVLQSLEDPSLGLMVADPYSFVEEYTVRLSDAEQNMLSIDNPEEVSVLVTVSIPFGKPQETCLNMLGPVIINHKSRLGLQVPQAETEQPAKIYLNQAGKKGEVGAAKSAAAPRKQAEKQQTPAKQALGKKAPKKAE